MEQIYLKRMMTKRLVGEEFTVTHTVGQTHRKVRLDQFVMEIYRHRSREKLKHAIDSGAITIVRNGSKHLSLGKVKPSTILQKGDVIHVHSVKRAEPEVSFDYKILFEDDEIMVVLKPANLPVHPAGRFFFNTLLSHLKTEGFKKDLEREKEFYLVHRIDKETSGVLLLAKTREACHHLTTQFKEREIGKYYLALVHGKPIQPNFAIDHPIGKISGSKVGLKMYPVPETQGGAPSLTEFEIVESRENFSLLACFPKTGRQHQIRVHAELAGVPLVGDKIYGLTDAEACALMDGNRDFELSLQEAEDLETISEENLSDLDALFSDEDEEDDSDENDADHIDDLSDEEIFSLYGEDENEEEEMTITDALNSLYEETKKKLLLPRHALHAAGIKFKHPRTNEEMIFESGLPDDLRSFFESLTGARLKDFKTQRWGF
jgi:23S rRNA pseudouridine1911/1915/1917 synthase